jgi:hypothetical protein
MTLMPQRFVWLAIWLFASVLAALSCAAVFTAAHVGSEYVPVGNDSFYHARRILDTAKDPAGFYEFDDKIHAPEGSLLVWPWGYDYALAMLVRAGVALGVSSDPMAILTWIPVAAVFVNIGLLVLVTRRLQLSAWPATIAALCMALAPTTQLLHGPGEVDHHFAELMFLLASLAAGLAWLQNPTSRRAAATLGVLLGTAPAVHNGLFVLQLPLLGALFIWWLQQRRVAFDTALVFAGAVLISTLAVLIPSLPFQQGRFEFYTLSRYHLYVAGCTAIVVTLLSRTTFSRRTLLMLVTVSLVLSIPLLGQLGVAGTFVGGMNPYLESIDEMRSPLAAIARRGAMAMAADFSGLLFVAPITFALCIVQCWRDRGSYRLLFWITAALGLALSATQQRMHYFGGFALYLPWLVLAADAVTKRPELGKKLFLGATLVALLAYAPALRYQLLEPMAPANDTYFEGVRPLLETLRKECEREPGIVLADNNAGHPIRFYTDCSVIANNFLLTQQHFTKLDQADHLFSLSAAELARQQPKIRYLFIRALAMREIEDGSFQYQLFFSRTAGLASELLYSDRSRLPPGYTLLQEMSFAGKAPYARLFRIEQQVQQVGE